MSNDIRAIVELNGGAYIKIGYRWYRLEALPADESDEAERTIERREREMLAHLGLKGK